MDIKSITTAIYSSSLVYANIMGDMLRNQGCASVHILHNLDEISGSLDLIVVQLDYKLNQRLPSMLKSYPKLRVVIAHHETQRPYRDSLLPLSDARVRLIQSPFSAWQLVSLIESFDV